ncbi:hypothetical protein ACF090_36525 [Streptomyces sp. NPDC014892]|uniref:hypothetical protein n=1 Tax=Streptomyces sp. NPDC014892 TaxID=3364930 RepID=UPI0036F9A38D
MAVERDSEFSAYPESSGWSEQEQQDVAALRERERELIGVILTHASDSSARAAI